MFNQQQHAGMEPDCSTCYNVKMALALLLEFVNIETPFHENKIIYKI